MDYYLLLQLFLKNELTIQTIYQLIFAKKDDFWFDAFTLFNDLPVWKQQPQAYAAGVYISKSKGWRLEIALLNISEVHVIWFWY